MKQKKSFKGYSIVEVIIIIIITSIISALATGIILSNNNRTQGGSSYSSLLQDSNVKSFLNVYSSVINGYYENVDKKAAMDSAINGLMNYLGDKYTSYLDSSDTNTLNSKLAGEYTGIGVSLGDNGIIKDVFDDSPAAKAGIQVNDKIVAINDTDVTSKSSTDMTALIKANTNNTVKVTINRDNNNIDYNLKLDTLYVPAISTNTIEQNNHKIGYIYISTFSSSLHDQVAKALTKLENENIDSLILDVRGNGGGYLSAATDTASIFLKKGQVIYSLEDKSTNKTTYDETDESRNYPIVVLIDSGSASASEILTGALKDSYGAILVGNKSYGKGKVQQTYQLDDGSMVKYTSAKWFRPNGECVDEVGITPDYVIDLKYNKDEDGNITDFEDTQLNKAVEVISNINQ
jgi:carboxyl-terminal processing protease